MKFLTFSSLLFRIPCFLLALWFLSVGLFPGHALAEAPTEYKVKAAFLYHFVQFTEWPEHAFPQKDTRIRICVYGDNSFEGLLERTFDGKSINARRFLVQHHVSTEESEGCHVLFVNGKVDVAKKSVQRILQRSKALIVGETEDFLEYGGMIQFYRAENKIRFAVNPEALERKNIYLSSKLLRLAKIVKSE